jgi:hypothetical protein
LARCFDDNKTYEKLKKNEEGLNSKKTAFEHIQTIFEHYNNKYNPFKVFSGDSNEKDTIEYYIEIDNPALTKDKEKKTDEHDHGQKNDEHDHHDKPLKI